MPMFVKATRPSAFCLVLKPCQCQCQNLLLLMNKKGRGASQRDEINISKQT